LAPAELAEADHHRGDEGAVGPPRNAVALDERVEGEQPSGVEHRFGQRRQLAGVAVDVGDAEQVAPDHGELVRLLDPSEPVPTVGDGEPGGEDRRERETEITTALRAPEGPASGEPGEGRGP